MTYKISSKDCVEVNCRKNPEVINGVEIERGVISIVYKDFASAYRAHKKLQDNIMEGVNLPTFD